METFGSRMQAAKQHVEEALHLAKLKKLNSSTPIFMNATFQLSELVADMSKKIADQNLEISKHSKAEKLKESSGGRIQETISSTISQTDAFGNLEDVIGYATAKVDIARSILLPFEVPEAFQFGVKSNNMFLLYGLPGMGKSFFAGAMAKHIQRERGATFFNVSASHLLSVWQSESEKALIALFDRAEEEPCSIIFLDEVDELLGSRTVKDSETSGRLKQVFLRATEGIHGRLKHTFIIAATNRPWVLDEAAWSRFQRKYYIPLPNETQREEIIHRKLCKLPHEDKKSDMKRMVKMSSGYSGRDIQTVVSESWITHVENFKDDFKRGILRPLPCAHIIQKFTDFRSTTKIGDLERMNDFLQDQGFQ